LHDLERAKLAIPLRPKAVPNVEKELYRLVDTGQVGARTMALLPPESYDRLDAALKDHSRIVPIVFRISEESWPIVSDAIGMPFPSPIAL